jgi:PKD repeat protein
MGTLYVDYLYIKSSGSGSGTDDNKLTWTASTDDGAGADDVTNYNVYKSSDGSLWISTASITADNSATYSYVDSSAGTADSTQWWYKVAAEDNGGLESPDSNFVQEPFTSNNPPVADFTYTTTDLTVDFTDTSTDSDGSIVSWSWEFGDEVTTSAQNPSHAYSAAGTYTVSLTVTDDNGGTDSTSQIVTITDGETGSDIWVSEMSWRTKSAGHNLFLYHKVTVMSDDGPVSSATVYSTLSSSDDTWYFSGITDSNGQVEFSLKTSSTGTYTAFVMDITHASYTYDPTLNVGEPYSTTI